MPYKAADTTVPLWIKLIGIARVLIILIDIAVDLVSHLMHGARPFA
jgi:hypothetical protein